ncbi:MAG: hypothetical protein ACC645_04820 [Pirellulales bacterium]
MAASTRTLLLTRTHKVLKKHYKVASPPADRSLIEHLLFACCLENSDREVAENVYAILQDHFFDWNEVRVSTVRELSEVMTLLEDPDEAAYRLKNILQSVFESVYAFDLETLKKQNIGQAVTILESYAGTTSFSISYVVQSSLGGHSIPVNQGALQAFRVIGAISEAEAAKEKIPGLERAVPKSKGPEIGSLLHQLGVELRRNPYGPAIRKILLEIAPECKERLPKRPVKKKAAPPKKAAVEGDAKGTAKETTIKKKTAKLAKPSKGTKTAKSTAKSTGKKKAPPKKKTAKKPPATTAKRTAQKKTSSKVLSKRKPR